MSATLPLSLPTTQLVERITSMAGRTEDGRPEVQGRAMGGGMGPAPGAPPPVDSNLRVLPRDYYDKSWGMLVAGQRVDETEEAWFRYVPLMRAFGFVVLAVAIATAYPRVDPDGWRGPAALLGVAALTAVFWIMWVRRPLWSYSTRTLAAHGALQLATYAALVSLSPSFAILQLIVYPQIVFSLPLRWAVAGGVSIGAITGLAIMAQSSDGLTAALPWMFYSLLTAAMVVAIAVWMRQTISQSMERRALIQQLHAARQELAAVEREAAVAEERARFAREIHDTLAQGFASVVTHLEAADASLGPGQERARRDVRSAEAVARASLAEARTLVWALRPESIAAAGLPAAIERLADMAAAGSGGPAVEVTISGPPRALHPEVEVTLLRAAQETLANARRHAEASHINLTLTYFADEVSLDVADDGHGFDEAAAGRSGGLGLIGMRERAERLGGTLTVETAPDEGTAIAVTLPAIEPPVPASALSASESVGRPAAEHVVGAPSAPLGSGVR